MFSEIFTGLVYSMQSHDKRFNCYFKTGVVPYCLQMHVSHLSVLLSSYFCYAVVFRMATLVVAFVALIVCVTYLRACFLASLRALRSCIALHA